MPRKIQASKNRYHPENDGSLSRLSKELREEWKKNHPADETVSFSTLVHLQRAEKYPLPEDIEEDSLVATSFYEYLRVRGTISKRDAERYGHQNASRATADFVCRKLLIPDPENAPIEDVVDVSRGIAIAKIALSNTKLYED